MRNRRPNAGARRSLAPLFEQAFDAATDGMMIADRRGLVLRTNHKADECFPNDSAIGLPFWNVLGLKCIDLDTAKAQLLDTGWALGAAERTYLCKSTNLLFDIRLVGIGNDERGSYLLVLHDITYLTAYHSQLQNQIRERTAVLERSQELLRTVFQGVGKGIVLVDEDLEIVECNQKACEIFGLNENNIVGTDIRSLCHEDNRQQLNELLVTLVEHEAVSRELTAVYFDKRTFPAVFTVSSVARDNKPLWIVITEDISEQKTLEQQLVAEKAATEEANLALRGVLKNLQNERYELTGRISRAIGDDIVPALQRLGHELKDESHRQSLRYIEGLLVSLTSGTDSEIRPGVLRLSKTEVKICKYVQAGLGSKEICTAMNLSFDTIQTHRRNIRRKLGLSGSRETSLYVHLAGCKL
jgi:PAS domain S-box-containing protein